APSGGVVPDVHVRVLTDVAITALDLLGSGFYLSAFDPNLFGSTLLGCWVNFTPQPASPPSTGVPLDAHTLVRFSEPMDPASVRPFDSFLIVRDNANTDPPASDKIVVGDIQSSPDLKQFTFVQLLNFSNSPLGPYHVRLVGGLTGVTDLAGNPLKNDLPFFNF